MNNWLGQGRQIPSRGFLEETGMLMVKQLKLFYPEASEPVFKELDVISQEPQPALPSVSSKP